MAPHEALAGFSPAVRAWFETSFEAPTSPQIQAWPAIASGANTLVAAPTGTGKTLTAFLWGIDRMLNEAPPEGQRARTHRTRLLYISPLRALAVDVERNLRSPLRGSALAAERLGEPLAHLPTVGVRTGDTPADERRSLQRRPPDMLITTPESLYLMLTSAARETLAGVEAVIIDEIHALVPTKRGAHLALSLERLEQITDLSPQRIGLSATQRPLEEVARFLGGRDVESGEQRPVRVIDAGARKELDLDVVVPVSDMAEPEADSGIRSIWPSLHPKILERIGQHQSTLVFVNNRRLAERLASRLNELAAEGDAEAGDEPDGETAGEDPPVAELVRAHHGSLSPTQRREVEDQLKRGELRGLVATSSLELGIDMGAIDCVVQVESPGSVAAGLQRIGRAGHQVGQPSRGTIFPKHRGDLLEAATVVARMHAGEIEHIAYQRNPLDVLAQQIVAMCALDEWPVQDLGALIRSSAPFADLSDELLRSVLDMLAGRYSSEEFAQLRPRIVWDRAGDVIRGRSGAQRLAVTNPGTIPDRGLFGVFLPDGTRVGELDEEMVYESRAGENFLLGASTWRIEEITVDRVIVTPAPGQPGRMPFWHGDRPGRPLELGRAVGGLVRRLREMPAEKAEKLLVADHGLDELAARNLLAYLDEQASATGAVPDDRTIVVERFTDEVGDWRICVLTPFGSRVHAPWATALRSHLSQRWGVDPEILHSDDGMVLRLPESVEELSVDDIVLEPEDVEDLVVTQLPGTALFASRFREAAARALLLPRRRPDRRTPLWQQRQRAADLLAAAARHPDFPILLEVTRECCGDVFDLPALREVLGDIRARRTTLVAAETSQASPFAQSLLFAWIAASMYEGDTPLAERRATALALDRELLADLLGSEGLRDLLDPGVIEDLEQWLQRKVDGRRARSADELHDVLRELGPLDESGIAERCEGDPRAVAAELVSAQRAIEVTVAGRAVLAAAEDAARLRDALGVALPAGLPAAFTEPQPAPVAELVARYARTHGPFTAAEAARSLGLGGAVVTAALDELAAAGRVGSGELRPGGTGLEWCDQGVLRRLRQRSLAAARREVEPVDAVALARFLPAWQGVGGTGRGSEALLDALAVLQGARIPVSVLETEVLPARLGRYDPAELDSLCTAGELIWVGSGAIGSNDGRIRLLFADQAELLVEAPAGSIGAEGTTAAVLRDHLAERGASFWRDLTAAVQRETGSADEAAILAALWDLVWAGEVTNDSLTPLRALVGGSRFAARHRRRATRRTTRRRSRRPDLGESPRTARAERYKPGPATAAGRWSLVSEVLGTADDPVAPTARAFATARQLLERHGVLTREAALAEGVEGGFAGIYPVLREMEERGQLRRGYFVAGLGAAQFALPGAVDRLRSHRGEVTDGAELRVLAATDPAQPYGAALRWPDSQSRPARAAGARVVLAGGELVAYVERGGRSLVTFEPAGRHPGWVAELARLIGDGRIDRLEISRIDGEPASESVWAEEFLNHGFSAGYRGLVARSPAGR